MAPMYEYIVVLYSSAEPSDSSSETSTCWPAPVCARCSSAASTPIQALGAPKYSAGSPPVQSGSLSGSPVMYISPDSAIAVSEFPWYPAYGPVCPNGVTEQYTSPGNSAFNCSYPRLSDAISP